MRRVLLAMAVLVALPLAGCTSGSQTSSQGYGQWSYSAGGQGNADQTDTLDVPTGQVRGDLSVGGQASIHLAVQDADGEVVLRIDCSGSGGCSRSQTSDTGEPGEWSIELQGLYNGGVSANVQVV